MATQRALLVQEIGKPLVLFHDRPIPEPGRGQLLVKVTVAGKSDQCRNPSPHQLDIQSPSAY
jgi:D-arabinose 1-dehydrogenase-like Zn-dependent alcohol dehydrogenase